MRLLAVVVSSVLLCTGASGSSRARPASQPAGDPIRWLAAPQDDARELDAWRRAVGPPVVIDALGEGAQQPPTLDELVIVSWNAHLAEGRIPALVQDLRAGRWTDGRSVQRFVLLLQEAFRRGADVPEMSTDARAAFAIVARDPGTEDIGMTARTLGLAALYVPSMRNGATQREDRGNAIVSTQPLTDHTALELPFERQRRVAIAATVSVDSAPVGGLRVMSVHLEPLSAPSLLWLFRNPRRAQITSALDALDSDPLAASAGRVVGGDFNTLQGGSREEVYAAARAWSRGLEREDARATHALGRLDYLFVQLPETWSAKTMRLDDRYGSDHHPVMARFRQR